MNFTQYSLDMNTEEFAKRAAHQLEDFIDSCKWQSKPCDMARDFTTTLTDIGVCYTFNEQPNPRQVTEPGAGNGLSLVLNVEQYEYMRGPQNDAGVKILLHSYGETPLVKDMGFAAAPGTHTLVSVHKHEVKSMPNPYGHCQTGGQPMSNCLTQCKTKYIMKQCHCRDMYMPDVNITEKNATDNSTIHVSYPVCGLAEKYKCIDDHIQFEGLKQMNSECECPVTCERMLFYPTLSHAHLSKINVEHLVLTDPKRKGIVEKQFLKAREMSQHVNVDIAEHDEERMKTIIDLMQSMSNIIQAIKPKMTSPNSLAQALGLPNVLGLDVEDIIEDIYSMLNALQDEKNQLRRIPNWFQETHRLQENLKMVLDIQGKTSTIVKKLLACIPNTTTNATTTSLSDGMSGLNSECKNLSIEVYHSIYCLKSKTYLPGYKPIDSAKELQDLSAAYENFTNTFFPNSTDLIPGHMACTSSLEFLSDTYAPIAQEITDIANNVTGIEDLAVVVQRLFAVSVRSNFLNNSFWKVDSESHVDDGTACKIFTNSAFGKIINCSYPFDLIRTIETGIVMLHWIRYRLDFLGNHELIQIMKNARDSFHEVSVSIKNLYRKVNQLMPILDHLQHYIKRNATKKNLFDRFDSVTVQQALSELATKTEQLDSSLTDLITNIDAIYEPVIEIYGIYIQIGIPSKKSIFSLNVFRDVKNSSFWAEMNNASTADLPTVHIWNETLKGYRMIAEEIQANSSQVFHNLSFYMDLLKKDLAAFGEGSQMNDNFYMNNFLQIDIFYSELKYQKVEQIPAFALLSLFSEVGGFLGLLLGASIITLCELVDYIIIALLKNCHKKRACGPDVTIREPVA